MNPWLYAALGALLGAGVAFLVAKAIYDKKLHAANQEEKAMLAKMRELERVRSTFVANVTHELKTPLTSIKGYVELLKNEERDKKTRRSFYEIIDIEAERLHALIEDILELSVLENNKADPRLQICDLAALGRQIQDRFRPQAEKAGVTLTVLIPKRLHLRGIPSRFKQLISNLVDNAIKYNKPGGSVLLRAFRESGHVVIRVSDTGIGIPEEHLSHIFERFYRVDKGRSREMGGTGLGLSIVKHVVQLHGGAISVDSAPGQGTQFTVRLPE